MAETASKLSDDLERFANNLMLGGLDHFERTPKASIKWPAP